MNALTDRLSKVFRDLRGLGRISPENVDEALRAVRTALLEADVHFKVVKNLLDGVVGRAKGAEVLQSVTPGDTFVKVFRDEIVRVLSAHRPEGIRRGPKPPTVLLFAGLQGSGKTTTAAKMAAWIGRKEGGRVGVAACDLQRPAAVEQLRILAEKAGAVFLGPEGETAAPKAARRARARAEEAGLAFLLVDSAGRHSLDDDLMREIEAVRAACLPDEVLLVVDAATGHAALSTAEAFHARLGATGVVLARSDGDARGGAALSIAAGLGVPVRWVGTGERLEDIEAFDPARAADRILGMGDVVGLVERAERAVAPEAAARMAEAVSEGRIDLELFLEQLQGIRRMGSVADLVGMLPGLPPGLAQTAGVDDHRLRRFEAIIRSMTPEERRKPGIIDGSRRRRIASGSGATPAEVNDLLRSFEMGRKVIEQFAAPTRRRRRT